MNSFPARLSLPLAAVAVLHYRPSLPRHDAQHALALQRRARPRTHGQAGRPRQSANVPIASGRQSRFFSHPPPYLAVSLCSILRMSCVRASDRGLRCGSRLISVACCALERLLYCTFARVCLRGYRLCPHKPAGGDHRVRPGWGERRLDPERVTL